MGIYYAAVDDGRKEYFMAPEGKAIKSPGIFHPKNPFGCMVVMMNAHGDHFDIENDMGYCWQEKEYKDITEEVYQRFLTYYPWAKEYYEIEVKDEEK